MAHFFVKSAHCQIGFGNIYNGSGSTGYSKYGIFRDTCMKKFQLQVEHNSERVIIYKDTAKHSYRLLGSGNVTNLIYTEFGQGGYQQSTSIDDWSDIIDDPSDNLNIQYSNKIWNDTEPLSDPREFTLTTRIGSGEHEFYTYYSTAARNINNIFHPHSRSGSMTILNSEDTDYTFGFGVCPLATKNYGANEGGTPSVFPSIINSIASNTPIGAYNTFNPYQNVNGHIVKKEEFKPEYWYDFDINQTDVTYLDVFNHYFSSWAFEGVVVPDHLTRTGRLCYGSSAGTNGADYAPSVYANLDDVDRGSTVAEACCNKKEAHVPYANLQFFDIYVTQSLEDALAYINDGTVPPDADYTSSETQPDPDPAPEDDDVGSKIAPQTQTKPTKSATTSGNTNYFVMTEQALKSFYNWFWDPDTNIIEIIQNWYYDFYGDLTQFLVGAYYFPIMTQCYSGHQSNKEIIIGRFGSGISAPCIDDEPDLFEIGWINIQETLFDKHSSFLDLEPYTKYKLYLPYLGIIDLPTNTLNQLKYLHVTAVVDVVTQQLKYVVFASKSQQWKSGIQIYEKSVPFGDSIPLNMQSGAAVSAKLAEAVMETGVAVGATVMSGGLGASSLVSTMENFHSIDDKPTMVGTGNGAMGKWGSKRCMLICEKVVPRYPENYDETVGYPLYEKRKLSTLSGYTVCENPKIEFGHTKLNEDDIVYPLESEKNQILSLLSSGVYL